MDRLKDIKWYEWVMFCSMSFLTLPVFVKTLSSLDFYPSSLMPAYAIYMFFINGFVFITVGLLLVLGIVLYVLKRKFGWILLLTNATFFLIYSAMLVCFFSNASPYYLLFIFMPLSLYSTIILTISHTKFRVQKFNFVIPVLLSISLALLEKYQFNFSIFLTDLLK